MEQIFLTRRNLLTLLSKLDRKKVGDFTYCTIIKQDTVHPRYPCSSPCRITAIEDADYYTDREPGPVNLLDEPCVK